MGKLSELRGIFTLIESLPMLPKVHAAFGGSNTPQVMAEMTDLAKSIGVGERVHIVPYVPAASVTWYVASADIGVSPLLPTSAHHAALPTKIRECLHARLPIVASDLRAQGAFVREEGIGEMHEPGDAASLARAVQLVLERREQYDALFNEEFLQMHSWDHEQQKLTALWHRLFATAGSVSRRPALTGLDALSPAASAHVGGPTLALTTNTSDGDALARAWRSTQGPVVALAAAEKLSLEASLMRWSLLEEHADKVLFPAGSSLTNGFNETGVAGEISALRASGIHVGSFMADAGVLKSEDLIRMRPGHPAQEWSRSQSGSYDRAVRVNTSQMLQNSLPIFTHSWNAGQTSNVLTYAPPVVDVDPELRQRDPDSVICVVVLSVSRSAAEEEALAQLETRLRDRGMQLERPRGRGFDPTIARDAGVLIAGLTVSDMSSGVAHALATGGIVVADAAPELSLKAAGAPVVEADTQSLTGVVLEMVAEFDLNMRSARAAHLDYARGVFSGSVTVSTIDAALAKG